MLYLLHKDLLSLFLPNGIDINALNISQTELNKFSSPEMLIAWLNQIAEKAEELRKPLSFQLIYNNHAISINYHPDRGRWIMFDANLGIREYFPSGTEILASDIRKQSFQENSSATVPTYLIVTGLGEINQEALNTLVNQHNHQWDAMDTKLLDGGRPLLLAANEGHLDIVKALLSADADKETLTPDGWTPLSLAANAGHLDIVKALLDAGANKEAPGPGGWTPLSLAVNKGHLDIVKALLDAGVDTHYLNDDAKRECLRLGLDLSLLERTPKAPATSFYTPCHPHPRTAGPSSCNIL